MYRVAMAIDNMGIRDWFDYLSVIAPLFLSGVAIWISIATARKQNQIALFGLRHEALVEIHTIFSFDAKISESDDGAYIVTVYDGLFGTTLSTSTSQEAIIQIVAITRRLENKILIRILTTQKEAEAADRLIYSLQTMMLAVIAEREFAAEREAFHRNCVDFEKRTYYKLSKKVKA